MTLRAVPIAEFLACRSVAPVALLGTDEQPILPSFGLGILAGQPGVGKTTLAIDLALHLAGSKEWLGLAAPRPLRVLVIENEGPREPFRRKLASACDAFEATPAGLFVLDEPWAR